MEKIKIILADDHQIVLDGIQAFLEKESDIQICGLAHNGEEALLLMEKQKIDVAILDISMPLLDGLETAKRIRQEYPDTGILLLSMHGDGQFILNAMKLVQGYIIKEKSKEVLVSAIHSVFRGGTYWSPDLLPRIAEAQRKTEHDNQGAHLTTRETEILCMLAKDPSLSAREIGQQLYIEEVTIQTHIRNIKQKLGYRRTTELVIYTLKNNLCK